MNAAYEVLKDSYQMNEECYRLLVFRYIFLIAYGCFMEQKKKINKYLNVGAFLLGFIFIYMINYGGYQPKIIKYWSGTSFFAALYIAPIFYFIFGLLRGKKCYLLEAVGKASYNIFLFQLLYFYYLYSYLLDTYNNRVTQIIASIFICTVGGIIFYHIENLIVKKILRN